MFLNFLPIAFLVIAAIIIFIVDKFRPSIGGAWISALLGSLFSLGTILVFRWYPPPELVIENWLEFNSISFPLAFGFDSISWIFAFCVIVVLTGIFLTVPIRLTVSNDPKAWILDIILTATALLSVLAKTPITLILVWTMIDILEVVVLVIYSSETAISRQAVISLAARIVGTWVLLWAMFYSQFQGSGQIDFTRIPTEYGLMLLLAVALRLGIFPIFIPFSREIPVRRELGTVLRFIVPVSSLTLLSRLSDLIIPSEWAILLSVVALLASIFGGIMFFLSSSELTGRSYWLVALAGMAIVSVVRGRAEAGLSWTVALILLGSFLSLHSYRKKSYLWLMIIGFLGITGLPFSPVASGWSGLIVFPFNLLDILYMVVHIVLLIGFMKHAFRIEEPPELAERWMLILYPLGLGILIAAQWFIGVDTLLSSINNQVWWASLITTGVALVISALIFRIQPKFMEKGDYTGIDQFPGTSSRFWIYRPLEQLFFMLQSFILMVTNLLEGEGGVFWAFLLFIMVLTLIGVGTGGAL